MFKKRIVKGSTDSKRKRLADVALSEVQLPTIELPSTATLRRQEAKYEEFKTNEEEGEDDDISYLSKEKEEQSQEMELRRKERKQLDEELEEDRERKLKQTEVSGVRRKALPKNIKTVTVTDYQPEICKDFQKTGYCGYGDSCKFLHCRDDFVGGWKLNSDWKVDKEHETEVLKELEQIPFKCFLCKGEYKSPVVTKCGHYFCSSCFMKQMKISTKCPICGTETNGVAKMATKLRSLLKGSKLD